MSLTRTELIILATSLAVKAAFFVLLYAFVGHGVVLEHSDSNLLFAQNWYYHGVFSGDITPPYNPSAINTPGYPLFLIVTGLMTGWVGYTVIIQILLVSAAAILLYRTLKNIFDERVAFYGALVFAIEPWNAYAVNFPLTEALFLSFFIVALALFESALRLRRVLYFFLSGLFLGLATMVRPIAEFLPLLFLFFLGGFYQCFNLRARTVLTACVMLLVGYACILMPYVIRNHAEFGTFALATKGPFTVHFYDVSMLLQYRESISAGEATERLFSAAKEQYPEVEVLEDLMGPQYAGYLNERSFAEIMRSPFLYVKLHASSLVTFFFSDGYRLILQSFGIHGENPPNITFLVLQGKFAMLFSYLTHNALAAISFLGGVAFWAITTILAFAAIPIAFFREKNPRVRAYLYFFGALMLYFAVLTGLAAMARYRVPVTPFLFPLAAYSLFFFFRYTAPDSRTMDHISRGLSGKKRSIPYRYYYDDLRKLLSFILPKDARAFWVDEASPDALPVGWKQYDYILMVDTIGSVHDIERTFVAARRVLTDHGLLVLTFHNYLWEPVFAVAEKLHLKARSKTQSWLSESDVRNLLYLAGFEVVRSGRRMLFPVYIPIVSAALNWLGLLPLINRLCVTNYIVARPAQRQRREYSVSILVPARNEKGNIQKIVERIPPFGTSQELVFVEGHSKDGTWDEIQRVASAYKGTMSIVMAQQDGIGKGDAVRKGFMMAQNEVLMILDADMTVAPEDLVKFYDAIADGKADFVNGSRLVYPMEKQAMRFLNTIANKCFALLFTWLLDQQIKDTLCGTKVLRKHDYEAIARNRGYFGDFDPFGDFDLLFGAVKQNLKIIDLPIRYRDRTYGTTQISRFRHGWLLLQMCLFAARKIKFL
jgi:hypothetical protein